MRICAPITCDDSTKTATPVPEIASTRVDTETAVSAQGTRRSSRRKIPNSKYVDDYISPTISPIADRVVSPKRVHSPSASTGHSKSEQHTPARHRRKKAKDSPPNSPARDSSAGRPRQILATVNNLQLTWPRYGIRNAIYEGNMFSVTNTCPLDTGLFILYHAYKAASENFRALFESDTLPAFEDIRRTFQLVEGDGWTVGRLYWLVRHGLLKKKNDNCEYDIENTLTEIVFRFVQPMQEYSIRSKCSCAACPKSVRQSTSVDITLT